MWKFEVNKIFILYHNINGGAEVKFEMEFDKESH